MTFGDNFVFALNNIKRDRFIAIKIIFSYERKQWSILPAYQYDFQQLPINLIHSKRGSRIFLWSGMSILSAITFRQICMWK